DEVRASVEEADGVSSSSKPGLKNNERRGEIEAGTLQSKYVIGGEMAWVESNSNHVQEILGRLDFCVVQDVFLSKRAQFADVVSPAAPSL
ncbi:hypothetical protein NV44_02775, partial [Listeria monocytogenes]